VFHVTAQAIDKGIRALLHHAQPLRVAGDVDTLRTSDGGTVGQGTRDKLKEILARGFLQRNLELEKNEEHQCVQLVRPPVFQPSLLCASLKDTV
jgi:hypothetical protein